MFSNSFVVSIKVDGKFLKEDGQSIKIPFGKEYEIYLKNMDARKTLVSVYVDGEDVLCGKKLLMDGNSSGILEGFLQKDNKVKYKFKFIERIKEIEDRRGVYPEDGIISVTFDRINPIVYSTTTTSTIWRTSSTDVYSSTPTWIYTPTSTLPLSCFNMNVENNSAGITVNGSDSNQAFNSVVSHAPEGKPSTISFMVYGTKEEKVSFSRDKITCNICGMKNKNFSNFCSRCGARLNK